MFRMLQYMLHPYMIGFYVLLLSSLLLIIRRGRKQTASDAPPGSRGLPLIGETIQFMAAVNSGKGFYDFVQVRRSRYGKCFKTNIFRETQVFFSSTESGKAILNNGSGNFTKRYIKSIAELVGDRSLLCASQHHHRIIRSRLMELISTSSLSSFVRHFDELVLKSLSGWENQDTVIVLDQALKMTLKAMCKMLLGLDDGSEELETLQRDIASVYEAMLAFPLRLPGSRFYKGLQARKRVMKKLELMMNERRRSPQAHEEDDFLQHLMTNGDCDGVSGMTDTEIRDNILTMIIAGQDTTASAITWMVKYLGENQPVLDMIRDEQLRLAGTISTKPFLSLDDLNQMTYASKVVKESLRMASIVPWFPRLALHDCEIEGYKIQKGWNLNVDARSIHLDPAVYKNPHHFNPSRFDDDTRPYSFLAFGMGARTCLGMNMAKAMMLVFIHRLVTTYEWKVMDSNSSVENWALFSRLKSGCPVQVSLITKISASASASASASSSSGPVKVPARD